MKILMVCLGNICRSPLAQGVMESKIKEKRLNWWVDSAGTSSWHIGEAPDPRSISIARKNGIDISSQRGRTFRSDDFNKFDLILAMDSSNYYDIVRLATSDEEREKVKLIMNYAFPGENRAVPDPYYDGSFQRVYDLLDKACEKLLDEMVILERSTGKQN